MQIFVMATSSLTLLEFEGTIQWQTSLDGVNGWVNVTNGTGANTENYITAPLFATTFYRAEITHGIEILHSNGPLVSTSDQLLCSSQLLFEFLLGFNFRLHLSRFMSRISACMRLFRQIRQEYALSRCVVHEHHLAAV